MVSISSLCLDRAIGRRHGTRSAVAFALLAAACGGSSESPTAVDAGGKADVGHSAHADANPAAHNDAAVQSHDSGVSEGRDGGGAPDAARQVDGRASNDAGVDSATDAGVDAPPRDHGSPSTTYPAFTPDMPHVVANGGAVLAAPQIVTVTWPNETNVNEFEAFGDLLGTGAYWAATTSEYGVGPATSGPTNHIHVPDLPLATMSANDVANFIIDHVMNAATSGWPAPTPSSYYVLYLSAQTDLTFGTSDACSAAGGYHDTVTVNGVDTVYAVIPHCEANGASETLAASHELVEGSADPHPGDLPAYLGFDTDHLAWDVWGSFQDELGDACEFFADSFFMEDFAADGGSQTFGVQRTWSNANAAAGHDPCQPAAPGPYYNVVPQDEETISLTLSGLPENGVVQTKGYHIGLGETKTFAIGLYSDGPTGGPWALSTSESGAEGPIGPPSLTTSIDLASGENGNIAYVTVTVNVVNPALGGELLTIESQLGSGPVRYLPILISSQ